MHTHRPGKGARSTRAGHNGPVRFRTGTVAAFLVGYALGTRAGRERFEQMARIAGRVGHSSPVSGTTSLIADKAKAAGTLGVERLKDTIGVRLGWRDGDEAADAIAIDLAEDLALAINSRRHLPSYRLNHPTGSVAGPTQASSR